MGVKIGIENRVRSQKSVDDLNVFNDFNNFNPWNKPKSSRASLRACQKTSSRKPDCVGLSGNQKKRVLVECKEGTAHKTNLTGFTG